LIDSTVIACCLSLGSWVRWGNSSRQPAPNVADRPTMCAGIRTPLEACRLSHDWKEHEPGGRASNHPDQETWLRGQGVHQILVQEGRLKEATEVKGSFHIGDCVRTVFLRPALEVKVKLLTIGQIQVQIWLQTETECRASAVDQPGRKHTPS